MDLTKPSSRYRFYVLDIPNQRVLAQGMVCNGVTDKNKKVIYSNRPGSNASSKGLYKVGYSYRGRFGKAYKLHGLESNNSKAFARAVVLHNYRWLPEHETGSPIVQSQDCPTVGPGFFKELDKYIQRSRKPVLLYIQ